MAHCFGDSKRAYASGDGAGAKALSNKGKEHRTMMERLNADASAWIYASESRKLEASVGQLLISLFFLSPSFFIGN